MLNSSKAVLGFAELNDIRIERVRNPNALEGGNLPERVSRESIPCVAPKVQIFLTGGGAPACKRSPSRGTARMNFYLEILAEHGVTEVTLLFLANTNAASFSGIS